MTNITDTIMDRYIDIHSHILYGIDDGSKNYEESLELLRQHALMGITDVVLTPHYIENSRYKANNEKKKKIYDTLKEEAEKLNINLYLGNEVFVNNDLNELLKNGEISTINNSRYLLIELPMSNKIKNLTDILYELRINGIVPIIAHPERYEYVQKDYKYLDELKSEGALFQSNFGSILGIYGMGSKRCLKKLLKNDYISFISTDIHYPNSKIFKGQEKSKTKLLKILGEEKYQRLMVFNALKVLKNEELSE